MIFVLASQFYIYSLCLVEAQLSTFNKCETSRRFVDCSNWLPGTGEGSCKAPPFRAETVAWPDGCPDYAPCCSEYGYCQTRETWELGTIFRDCNGESNGLDLPLR